MPPKLSPKIDKFATSDLKISSTLSSPARLVTPKNSSIRGKSIFLFLFFLLVLKKKTWDEVSKPERSWDRREVLQPNAIWRGLSQNMDLFLAYKILGRS